MTRASMTFTGAEVVAVDAAWLSAFDAKMDMLIAAMRGATVIPEPEWLTVKQAAAKLGCSTSTIQRRIADGTLTAKGAGKLKRVKV